MRADAVRGPVPFVICLAIVGGYGSLMQRIDWGAGIYRAAGLFILLGFLAILRWRGASSAPAPAMPDTRLWRILLIAGAIVCWAIPVRTIIENVRHTASTGHIRLDEGETTWRAARLLLRGENPYAQGTLVDGQVYLLRQEQRRAAGIVPPIADADIVPTLEAYLDKLDPDTKRLLLPSPPSGGGFEMSLLGYKYGPVAVFATAALGSIIGASSVPVLNGLVGLLLFAVVGLLLRELRAGLFCGALALMAVVLDREIDWDMLHWSANDLWPLLFGFAGVLAWRRGHDVLLGVAVAIAVGCKIFPGALFTPLVLATFSWSAILAFALALVTIYGPFLFWNAHGFVGNLILWPGMTAPDSTGWVAYAPHAVVLPIRAVLGLCVLWIALRIGLRRERLLASAFAAMTILTILGGQSFHTNYLTWFSIWMVLAIVEAFGPYKLSAKWQAT